MLFEYKISQCYLKTDSIFKFDSAKNHLFIADVVHSLTLSVSLDNYFFYIATQYYTILTMCYATG
ncbi:hypothetical protein A9306_07820 [Moraxella atlantae]|uniref:Uncharacterized protein n=1 Tax=Faucicola atlantae TaxID=34059 RepID=A0A1B8QEM3_9GAMM|nr:hypothetical protein A9306_07820 [Moraxella atlantae]